MVVAERQVTMRDFLVFQMKLALDGLKDVVVFQVSIVAMVVDFLSGRGKRPRWFYSVMRVSERFDRWLDLHGAMRRSGVFDTAMGAMSFPARVFPDWCGEVLWQVVHDGVSGLPPEWVAA